MSQLQGQSIRFINDNLESALKIAEREGKDVFVDTYAPWCIPCKRMEPVFRDRDVGKYFNDHYVSVRINMDGDLGDFMRRKYQVIFLPTIMILDDKGVVKYQVDKVLTKKELMDIGRMVNETNGYFVSEATAISSSPITTSNSATVNTSAPEINKTDEVKKEIPIEKVEETIVVKEAAPVSEVAGEKILYVLGEGEVPPEILRQEAYFRMTLMDGSHRECAKKYLKTQADWSSEDNMRFIHDFLHSTASDEFRYFIINRHKFEALLGETNVQETVEILVDKTLNSGYPRPNLKEAQSLLSYVNPRTSRTQAHRYMLDRYYYERNHNDYLQLVSTYTTNIRPDDVDVYYTISNVCIESIGEENNELCTKLMKEGVDKRDSEPRFHETLAFLYFDQNNKDQALDEAEKALQLASKTGYSESSLLNLIEKIKSL